MAKVEGLFDGEELDLGAWLAGGLGGVPHDGEPVPTTRPVVAVCVCGKSQRRPWCDGTHKVIRR